MKGIVVLGASVALAGCIAFTGSELRDQLRPYKGRDIHDLVAHIGYPDGEREIMGQHLYVWSTNRTGLMPVTSLSTATGTAGSGIASTTSVAPMRFDCTLQVAVDTGNVIQSSQFQGNNGSCAQYLKMLRK